MEKQIEDFIGIYENAFDKKYCEHVINLFEQAKQHGFTFSRQKAEGLSTSKKNDDQLYTSDLIKLNVFTKETQHFEEVFWSEIYPHYAKVYGSLNDAGAHVNYGWKVQKTQKGGGYHVWHFESSTRAYSSRLLTWILYLNDVEEGGETEFLYYGKRVKPKQGTLVLWPAAFTHTHRGNPPLKDDKYIITGWIEF